MKKEWTVWIIIMPAINLTWFRVQMTGLLKFGTTRIKPVYRHLKGMHKTFHLLPSILNFQFFLLGQKMEQSGCYLLYRFSQSIWIFITILSYRVWHSNTYRLETTLNYGLERVWTICCLPGSNNIALGYDEGSIMIKLGREEPAMSMDQSGKIIWAKHSEIQQANLKALPDSEIKDGERLPLAIKDMGACEIYPQTVAHNPNGR